MHWTSYTAVLFEEHLMLPNEKRQNKKSPMFVQNPYKHRNSLIIWTLFVIVIVSDLATFCLNHSMLITKVETFQFFLTHCDEVKLGFYHLQRHSNSVQLHHLGLQFP